MADGCEIYKEDIPGWWFIFGPISALLIGQKMKGIVGIITWFIPGINFFAGLFWIIDSFMINKWMNENKKPIGPWTFFFQLDK